MPGRRIIADFNSIHRSTARRQGYDVADDAGWWGYVKVRFEGGFAQAGIDVSGQNPVGNVDSDAAPFVAMVNHGRWLTICPDCQSVSMIRRGNPLHLCLNCANGGVDAFRRVVWPADVDAIERALLVRPQQENRNWQAGETLADLLAENAERGL